MTLNRNQIDSWDPQQLVRLGEAWLTVGRGIEEKFEQYVAAVGKVNDDKHWEGQTAEAAQRWADRDRLTAYSLVDKLEQLAERAKLGCGEVDAPLQHVRHAIDFAENQAYIVTDDLIVVDTVGKPSAERVKQRSELQAVITDNALLAEEADARVDADLGNARGDLRAAFTSSGALGRDQGKSDGEQIATNPSSMTLEQQQRLIESARLTPEQIGSLQAGNTATVPASQMEYLNQVGRALDGKTPREVEAIMNRLPPESRQALANSFQILSNEKIKTSVAGDPAVPAKGGPHLLPNKIRESLTRDDLVTRRFGSDPAAVKPIIAFNGVDDNQAIARISGAADVDYKVGSALDKGLLEVGRQYLDAQVGHEKSGRADNEDIFIDGHPAIQGEYRPREADYNSMVSEIFAATGNDKVAVLDAISNSEHGKDFLDDVLTRQWSDDGTGASALFHFGENDATIENGWSSSDVAIATRTGDIMETVAQHMSTDEARESLLNIEGTDGLSVGQVNPELLETVAHSLTPYMAEFGGMDQADRPGFDTREWLTDDVNHFQGGSNVFAVMDSGQEAGNTFTQAAIREVLSQESEFAADVQSPSAAEHLGVVGRLEGEMNEGLMISSQDKFDDVADQAKAAYDRKSSAYDAAMSALSFGIDKTPQGAAINAVIEAGGDSLKESVIGEEPDEAEKSALGGVDFSHHAYNILQMTPDIPVEFVKEFPWAFDEGTLRPWDELVAKHGKGDTRFLNFDVMLSRLGRPGSADLLRNTFEDAVRNDG
ncbi:hypothetical protein ACHIPZ_04520 [Antrihabitans sp. NCIMB 15449]|uniref:TPR repeat domain-containing protein n=1 Tax=Antrihabitans spumae TaxID=3373370 RepID=A0ABW7JJX2_9NOCA